MSLYQQAANDLLYVVRNRQFGDSFYFLREQNFVFEYRRDYSGKMAMNLKMKHVNLIREKQGYFDVRGIMNGRIMTHEQILRDLYRFSNLNQCFLVFQGFIPETDNREEKDALLSLAMAMFEQEINFGKENFQQYSHFSPTIDEVPNYRRPRDLLMGYVWYMFIQGSVRWLNDYLYENKLIFPGTNTPVSVFCRGLENHPNANALMVDGNPQIQVFRELASHAPINPHLIKLRSE